jgi:hypothetical protein
MLPLNRARLLVTDLAGWGDVAAAWLIVAAGLAILWLA